MNYHISVFFLHSLILYRFYVNFLEFLPFIFSHLLGDVGGLEDYSPFLLLDLRFRETALESISF